MNSTPDNEPLLDQEILEEFVIEANEHLCNIEQQLLEVEKNGTDADKEILNRIFRGVHSIKGTAGFLGLESINKLAHSLENVLNLLRESELQPSSDVIDVTLKAADALCQLVANIENSNQCDISSHTSALTKLAAPTAASDSAGATPTPLKPTRQPTTPRPTILPRPTKINQPPQTQRPARAQRQPSSQSQTKTPQTAEAAATPPNLKETTEPEVLGNAKSPVRPKQPANSVPEPAPTVEPERDSNSPVQSQAPTDTSQAAAETLTTSQRPVSEGTIRVPVEALDHLMNLVGELVVSRNQLLQTYGSDDRTGIESAVSRINQVTGEVQDAIMQTRMQPIGNVFDRFTRQVRDLSQGLGKLCRLEIEGKDVEVDKSIIEAIGDPLTHLIRNAVDHGIEPPDDRRYRKKTPEGTISLRAFHQGGKVKIEISDDGKGIDPDVVTASAINKGVITSEESELLEPKEIFGLIFRPGFSTSESVTDVSGRGVGMDVVRTNIEKLGGMVEVDSRQGQGTTFTVTLPLTLAIIPSMIVKSSNEIFAIPQVNIVELVRIPRDQVSSRIGCVNKAEVLRLRDKLLPLVRLEDVLGLTRDSKRICDRNDCQVESETMSVIVVDVGHMQYGLIVDSLQDSEEIVIKPLGRHINNIECLAGATILGDGRIALIVDVSGVASSAKLQKPREAAPSSDTEAADSSPVIQKRQSLLLFRNHESDRFAIPMDFVARIESARLQEIKKMGRERILLSRGKSIPVFGIEDQLVISEQAKADPVCVVMFAYNQREFGLIAPILDDIRELHIELDNTILNEPGVTGSFVHEQQPVRMLNLHELVAAAKPDWLEAKPGQESSGGQKRNILLVDDSNFFRKQVCELLVQNGLQVEEATDGRLAWEKLQSGAPVDLIVTDIEMPNLNGFEFSHRVKSSRHHQVPIIALTSLHSQEYSERARSIGIEDYQVKLDRKKLMESVDSLLAARAVNHPQESGELASC